MKKIAKFEKVSYEQFKKDILDCNSFKEEFIEEMYNNIVLPTRATRGSAGYDFCSPFKFILEQNKTIKIPTGIRCCMEDGWVLQIYPRSSLGFKYRMQLDNSVGIVDEDYAYSDNEGHIFIKITNDSTNNNVLSVDMGESFAQGIFVEYGITVDDTAAGVRNGGFGSTNR